MTPDTSTPRSRIDEYLRQRELSRHHDPEDIHGIHTDPEAQMANLTVSDLNEILQELDELRETTRQYLDDTDEPVVYVLDDNHNAQLGLQPAAIRWWLSPDTAVDVEAFDDRLVVRVPPKGVVDEQELRVAPVSGREIAVEVQR
jgi:hypothetical protein